MNWMKDMNRSICNIRNDDYMQKKLKIQNQAYVKVSALKRRLDSGDGGGDSQDLINLNMICQSADNYANALKTEDGGVSLEFKRKETPLKKQRRMKERSIIEKCNEYNRKYNSQASSQVKPSLEETTRSQANHEFQFKATQEPDEQNYFSFKPSTFEQEKTVAVPLFDFTDRPKFALNIEHSQEAAIIPANTIASPRTRINPFFEQKPITNRFDEFQSSHKDGRHHVNDFHRNNSTNRFSGFPSSSHMYTKYQETDEFERNLTQRFDDYHTHTVSHNKRVQETTENNNLSICYIGMQQSKLVSRNSESKFMSKTVELCNINNSSNTATVSKSSYFKNVFDGNHHDLPINFFSDSSPRDSIVPFNNNRPFDFF